MISNITCEKFDLIDSKTGIILDDITNIDPADITCFIVIMCTHDTIKGFTLYDFEPYNTDQNTTYDKFIQKIGDDILNLVVKKTKELKIDDFNKITSFSTDFFL